MTEDASISPRLVLALAIALSAVVALVVFAVIRPESREDAAVGAAINAVEGDDPTAGTWGTCEHEPGLGALVLRARYECVVRSCRLVVARLEVTRDLLGGWTFDFTSSRTPELHDDSGETEALPSTTIPRLDPEAWSRGVCAES